MVAWSPILGHQNCRRQSLSLNLNLTATTILVVFAGLTWWKIGAKERIEQ
jgi:hypothetical protein